MFATRDVEGARRLTQHDLGINERDPRCFDLAVRERTDGAPREVALMLAMMARAIERIGDHRPPGRLRRRRATRAKLNRCGRRLAHRRRSRARCGDGLGYIDAMTETR